MKVSYFPGCTLKNKAKDLDAYAYRSCEALGVTLEEIEDWQCCGGVFTTANNEVATKLSSVRALKAASEKGQPLVTVCSACHNVIKQYSINKVLIAIPSLVDAKVKTDYEHYVRNSLGRIVYYFYLCCEHSVRKVTISLHSKHETNIKT